MKLYCLNQLTVNFYCMYINIFIIQMLSRLIGLAFTLYLFLLTTVVKGYAEADPVWLTSDFFRAGNEDVINTLTGNDQTPEYTFHFSSSLPGVPNLAYGIKNYIGNDYMGQERF